MDTPFIAQLPKVVEKAPLSWLGEDNAGAIVFCGRSQEWRQKVEKMVAKFLLPLYQPSSSPAAITHFYFLLPVLFSDMRILRMPPLLARFYSAAAAFGGQTNR